MKSTGGGRNKIQEIYKCNEVKLEAGNANRKMMEVTTATFTRWHIIGIHGYTRCVCNLRTTRSNS